MKWHQSLELEIRRSFCKLCRLSKLIGVLRLRNISQVNDKPGFVVGSYLSRCYVAITLKRSMFADLTACETYTIYFLLRTGFTWLSVLPHPPVGSYPTLSPLPLSGGLLSVALALKLLWPSVRWSPVSLAARTFLSQLTLPATTYCTCRELYPN